MRTRLLDPNHAGGRRAYLICLHDGFISEQPNFLDDFEPNEVAHSSGLLGLELRYLGHLLACHLSRLYHLRRSRLRHRKSACRGRSELEQHRLGVRNESHWQLASTDLAVTHAGLPGLRVEARLSSFDEPGLPYGKYGFAFPCPQSNDGCVVAQCLRRDTVCAPSSACGIGRVGRGEERFAEHVFRNVDALGIRALLRGIES